jgi:hypothetical protein
MQKSIYPLSLIFGLNERLFNNSMAGITDEQANERISDHNNPVIWIAAHTVYARYLMLLFLGKPAENPYNHLFENFKAYDAGLSYPSVAEIKREWEKVTALLKDALEGVTEEFLAGDSPIKSPIGDFTNAGTLAFLAQHESYDVGQLAFLKKYYTTEAMSYN